MTKLGIDSITVRFFIYDEDIINECDDTPGGIRECEESEFLEANYPIEYERHSVYANGVRQICLTKCPSFNNQE
jgi:hypothetical protein